MGYVSLKVAVAASGVMAFTNCVYCHPSDLAKLSLGSEKNVVVVQGVVYNALETPTAEPGTLVLTSTIRNFLRVEIDQMVSVRPFPQLADETLYLENVSMNLFLMGRNPTQSLEIDCRELSSKLIEAFDGQVLVNGMELVTQFANVILKLKITQSNHVPAISGGQKTTTPMVAMSKEDKALVDSLRSGNGGIFNRNTTTTFVKQGDAPLRLTGQVSRKSASNMADTDFEKLGIGGLNKEFGDIFRRAFVSRILPPEVVRKLGIKHVRGMMLHGPPGTGKTLIARQISKVLQGGESAREPKIVSGPDILSKFVGESEKNVRELFAEAEEEQASAGDDSELHVIIFDEIDAICKKRGASRDGTGVGDSVVNQLLAKIDGVNSLNNVLLIGMTNRLDMIDPALLRPGRFEVQVEIGLPDVAGRVQIINIHTKKMRDSGCLGTDVDIQHVANETKNFSGAEIEGLVKSAVSYATQRHINSEDISKLLDADKIVVTANDFESALEEIHPAFGVQGEEELQGLYRNGIVGFSPAVKHVETTLAELAIQSQTSKRTPLLSVLLSGAKGTGKSALVAKMALEAGFHYTKLISADKMIGMGENAKCSHIANIFEDAYKSPISLIVIDDIERIIEYIHLGHRFSNLVLQALLVLINKPPPREDRKLMIIGTTACPLVLEELGLKQVFNVDIALPQLETSEEVRTVIEHMTSMTTDPLQIDNVDLQEICEICEKPMPVKRLLVVLEMARQGDGPVTPMRFNQCQHIL